MKINREDMTLHILPGPMDKLVSANLARMMRLLEVEDPTKSDLAELLILQCNVADVERQIGRGLDEVVYKTLDVLAKGTFRVLTDKPFSCRERRDDYQRWANRDESLILEVRLKDPIKIAQKMALYVRQGSINGNGKIATPLDKEEVLSDVYGMRIIVDGSENDIYDVYRRLIGFMEGAFIKDYIISPKLNQYSSLHIIGVPRCSILKGNPIYVEIQIKTKEMNEGANNGGANHSDYDKSKYKMTAMSLM